MTRRQGHLVNLSRIPGRDNVSPTIRIVPDGIDDLVNLMDGTAIGGAPVTPLRSVDPTQVPLGIGPFIPNAHPVFTQVTDIGIPFEKPQQLVDNAPEMQFFGGQQGEAFLKVKTHLSPKDR
jgi:hypothetical protein